MKHQWLMPAIVTALFAVMGGVATLAVDSIRDLEIKVARMEQQVMFLVAIHSTESDMHRGGGR